eukprot:8609714-Ditylum_brightwellii.AAC.2
MDRRSRVPALVHLIGHGFFNVCGTAESAPNILTELKANPLFLEFGNKEEAQHQGSRKDLVLFKLAVAAGVTDEQSGVLFPQIYTLHPGFVNNCLIKANRMKLPSPPKATQETRELHNAFT